MSLLAELTSGVSVYACSQCGMSWLCASNEFPTPGICFKSRQKSADHQHCQLVQLSPQAIASVGRTDEEFVLRVVRYKQQQNAKATVQQARVRDTQALLEHATRVRGSMPVGPQFEAATKVLVAAAELHVLVGGKLGETGGGMDAM